MIQETVTFLNSKGEQLHGVIRVPEGNGKFPAVVICHGFDSNKDNEFIFSLWDNISRAGFVCMRFDFTGHGESKGSFRDFTITQEIRDVKNAVELLKTSGVVNEKKIFLIGHSLGASVAILAASEEKIKAVVAISGIARLDDFISSKFSEHQIAEWKRKGYVQFYDFDELSTELLKDIEKHDILSAAGRLKCPLLIMHGTDDTSVPSENAKEIFYHAKDIRKLELIEGADHRFTAPAHREELISMITGFLAANLKMK